MDKCLLYYFVRYIVKDFSFIVIENGTVKWYNKHLYAVHKKVLITMEYSNYACIINNVITCSDYAIYDTLMSVDIFESLVIDLHDNDSLSTYLIKYGDISVETVNILINYLQTESSNLFDDYLEKCMKIVYILC